MPRASKPTFCHAQNYDVEDRCVDLSGVAALQLSLSVKKPIEVFDVGIKIRHLDARSSFTNHTLMHSRLERNGRQYPDRAYSAAGAEATFTRSAASRWKVHRSAAKE